VEKNQIQETSAVKNIEFGFGGIFIGLVFVVIVMLALNYFRAISLSSFYSKLSVLPQKELYVEEKAEKAGLYGKGKQKMVLVEPVLHQKKEITMVGWINLDGLGITFLMKE